LRFLSAAFVFVCTVQMLHWPLLPKPGTPIDWWQVRWMARVGEIVGLPVLGASLPVGRLGLPPPGTSVVLHLLAAIWSLFLFFLAGRILKKKADPVGTDNDRATPGRV
jgi:hypothetical protein